MAATMRDAGMVLLRPEVPRVDGADRIAALPERVHLGRRRRTFGDYQGARDGLARVGAPAAARLQARRAVVALGLGVGAPLHLGA
jgi:hypothetical protein